MHMGPFKYHLAIEKGLSTYLPTSNYVIRSGWMGGCVNVWVDL